MISSSREADTSGVNRIGRTRSPAGPLPRIAIKPPALVPPSNLPQPVRGLDTGGADAAEHGAEEAKVKNHRRQTVLRNEVRLPVAFHKPPGFPSGVRRLIGVGIVRGLGPAQPAPGSVRNAAAAVWRSQGQVLTRGTGGAAHRRAVLHGLLRAPLVRGARTEGQERQNPRQLARSQHGILLSARRRGQRYKNFKGPFSARGRVRDGPVGCQVREPSVQDRGFFGRFIGPRRPDPGRFGLSRECRAKGAVGSGS